MRNLEIISQAIKDFGIEDLMMAQPGIPWREIAGMRNVLAHEYLGIDTVMIWETIQTELEVLNQALETIDHQ